MKTMQRVALIGLMTAAAGVATAAAQAKKEVTPTFDCTQATTAVERVICTHEELAALDQQMMRLFRAAVTSAPSEKRKHLYTEQARWIARRNDCGETDTAPVQQCIEAEYKQRIQQLQPPK